MLDRCVASREKEALVTVARPADEVRRSAVIRVDLENLAVPVGLVDGVTLDDYAVAW